jgi:hypothetical protein
MGANCPGAVPCLLRGCLDAGESSDSARQAVLAVANLSQREASRALRVLTDGRTMMDVRLTIALEHDPVAAACLVVVELSVPSQRIDQKTNAPKTNEEADTSSSNNNKSKPLSLKEHLDHHPHLLSRLMELLARELGSESDVWSRKSMFLNAYCWVLYRISRVDSDKAVGGIIVTCQDALGRMLKVTQEKNLSLNELETSPWDRFRGLLAVAILLTVTVHCSSSEGNGSATLWELFPSDRLGSRANQCFATRLLFAIKYGNETALQDIVESTLLSAILERSNSERSCADMQSSDTAPGRFSKVCSLLSDSKEFSDHTGVASLLSIQKIGDCLEFMPCIAMDLLDCDQTPTEVKKSVARTCLEELLRDHKKTEAFLSHNIAGDLVNRMTTVLVCECGDRIPLVLPIGLEKNSYAAVSLSRKAVRDLDHSASIFFLQLLYCFRFLDLDPSCPFAIDPRQLPLRHVYALCDDVQFRGLSDKVKMLLKHNIDRHSPETKWCRLYFCLFHFPARVQARRLLRENCKRQLTKILRKSIEEPQHDPTGRLAEKEFVLAAQSLSDADLFSTAASALLSMPSTPHVFFTYAMLYRDPLVLLKCSSSKVWSRSGTRRIALSLLNFLLSSNQYFVAERTLNEEVREEMISSRDEIVVRSLLCVVTSNLPNNDGASSVCAAVTAILRKMIADKPELAYLFTKQGTSEDQVDWAITSIPEIVDGFSVLPAVLSDRTSIPSAERLVAADTILRVAIFQGHRNTIQAESLTYLSLSLLLTSFFLILGPVGVPVSSFVGHDECPDATQVSRKAAMRMLKALQNVRGYRVGLKQESALSLQKLAGLCKGESIVGGLPASAGHQTTFLREMQDLIASALDALG